MIYDREEVFKLFRIPIAPLSWNILFHRIRSAEDIGAERKSELLNAADFLRAELGNGFFQTCGIDHPVKLLLDGTPSSAPALLAFVGTLKKLKNNTTSNYPHLLRKLKRRKDCKSEGMFFMDIAAAFLEEHFDIVFLEEQPGRRCADIQITDRGTKDNFQIEVTEINDSADRERSHKEHLAISNALFNYGYDLLHSSQQLQHIPDKKLKAVIDSIKQANDRAYENKELVVLRNDYVHIAVAHPAQTEAYNRWCKESHLKIGINGLRVDFNDTRRILQQNKIGKEVRHFSNNVTGLVYMPISVPSILLMNIGETIIRLAAELERYPLLLGLVLYSELSQLMPERTLSVLEHWVSIKHINGHTRYTIFIYNNSYQGKLSSNTIERIRKCIY